MINKDQITRRHKDTAHMEKVDAQILEGLDEKEAYISDGSGNPVKLGSN